MAPAHLHATGVAVYPALFIHNLVILYDFNKSLNICIKIPIHRLLMIISLTKKLGVLAKDRNCIYMSGRIYCTEMKFLFAFSVDKYFVNIF